MGVPRPLSLAYRATLSPPPSFLRCADRANSGIPAGTLRPPVSLAPFAIPIGIHFAITSPLTQWFVNFHPQHHAGLDKKQYTTKKDGCQAVTPNAHFLPTLSLSLSTQHTFQNQSPALIRALILLFLYFVKSQSSNSSSRSAPFRKLRPARAYPNHIQRP